MNLLEAAAMTLVTMSLLLLCGLFARHLGWEITDDMDGEVVCPNHPTEAA